jgi:hypothetical protein
MSTDTKNLYDSELHYNKKTTEEPGDTTTGCDGFEISIEFFL